MPITDRVQNQAEDNIAQPNRSRRGCSRRAGGADCCGRVDRLKMRALVAVEADGTRCDDRVSGTRRLVLWSCGGRRVASASHA